MVDTYSAGDRLVGKRVSLPDGRTAFIPGSYPLKADGESSSGGGTGASADQVQGTSASGVADDGSNPVKTAGRANDAVPTASPNGARVDNWVTRAGAQVIAVHAGYQGFGSNLGNMANFFADRSDTIRPLATLGGGFDGSNIWAQRGDSTGTWTKSPPLAGTDRSITASTTSQTLMAANATRSRILIRNDTTVDVWVNFGATAVANAGGGNFKIAANGGSLDLQGTSGPVNIVAASGTAAISARES